MAENSLGAVLTNLVTAIIFYRTFFVVDPHRYGALVSREWVVKLSNLRELYTANYSGNLNYGPQIDFEKLWDSNSTVINKSDLLNNAFDVMRPHRTDIPMTAEQRNRAEILFSHPIDDVARFESYGLAFINAIEFTDISKAIVNQLLKNILFRDENDE